MLILWLVVFIISLSVLVKSADWFLDSAEVIGLAIGMSPFIIGITIVSAGTSLPELVSGLFAVAAGASDIVAANVVGSNIANILLIGGMAAVITRGFTIRKKFLLIDMFLLGVVTALGMSFMHDGQVRIWESGVLLIAAIGYFIYTIKYQGDEDVEDIMDERPRARKKHLLMLILGIVGLFIGAKYVIESVVELSAIMNIPTGIISIIAIAFGTSLPELIVSVKAAKQGKANIVVGNILGSNTFNMLLVVGIPGLFGSLQVDAVTATIGLVIMALATLLMAIFFLDKRLSLIEGIILVLVYIVFIWQIITTL